ncbi:hypothetical protein [Streptomyces syringium]|uniref:hypothetical protein n=1 Tax=Streptomyces syringium TaxID=76729 RepID=UPI003432341D
MASSREPTPDKAPLMTLRVSRDSGRTYEPTRAVRAGDPWIILENPVRYPPCECPRCVPERQATRVIPAHSLSPA